MRTTLTALIHGESGVGKSWLGDTVPGPRLILDSEGRAKYTPSGPKVMWDPRVAAPPEYDGTTWQTCIVTVPDFETMASAYQWLRSGQHPFKSVVVDSLMEVQKRCMDIVSPGIGQLDQQNWGELLRRLEKLVREYRDLTLVSAVGVDVVVFIVGSKQDNTGKWEPLLQGALRDTLPYYIDVVGYYFKQPAADGSYSRALLVDQLPGFVAKDGTGRLNLNGPIIAQPNFEQLIGLLASTPILQEATA